ncbi:hypothetical protein JT201_03395, partial [Helicobacter pylori]|nr:hypothetical protein [Helicobacter pylori]
SCLVIYVFLLQAEDCVPEHPRFPGLGDGYKKQEETKQKKPIFKNKSFSNRAKNSVIKKFKNSNAF